MREITAVEHRRKLRQNSLAQKPNVVATRNITHQPPSGRPVYPHQDTNRTAISKQCTFGTSATQQEPDEQPK